MTELITLQEAAERLHHGMTVEALRKAVRAGDLRADKFNTKSYLTTWEWVQEWIECRGQGSPRGSTSDAMKANGSFATAESRSGQDMLRGSIERLKKRSSPTLQPKKPPPAAVLRIRGT